MGFSLIPINLNDDNPEVNKMPMDPTYSANARAFLAQTKSWQSEMNSWSTELTFLQRMLDIYGLKAMEEPHASEVKRLKQRMVHFLKETTVQQRQKWKAHEERLELIVEDRLLLEDRELPYKHKDFEKEAHDCRSIFHYMQRSAFELIEELKQF